MKKQMTKDIWLGIGCIALVNLDIFIMCLVASFIEEGVLFNIIWIATMFILPLLPGVALAVLLVRNTLKDFFKSWVICFLVSVVVFLMWNVLGVDRIINICLYGTEDMGLGAGLSMMVVYFIYLQSCYLGCIIAAIISFCRQRKINNIY